MGLDIFGLSDTGRVRKINEDSFITETPSDVDLNERLGTLIVVADGMGGAEAGEVASALVTRTIPEAYYSAEGGPEQALSEAILAAQLCVERESYSKPDRQGMGSTVVAASVTGNLLVVGHVGDSRAYLLRGDKIEQITRDHSLVAEMVAQGLLSPEQARVHPQKNVITRVMGGQNSPPDFTSRSLETGDVVLVCTDGLHGLVLPPEMVRICRAHPLADAVRGLVELANSRGGNDNLTVVLARYR